MSPVTFDSDLLTEQVAEGIRVAIARRQMSGREVARRIGKSQNWMTLRTTGSQSPTLSDISLIADALGMTPGELMGFGSPALANPEAHDVDEVLSDKNLPREARDAVLGLLGQAVALAYMAMPKRRALPPAPKEPKMTERQSLPRPRRAR